ncbi:MAG TPA: sodium:solute symporter family protein [Cyclobacteriaceae bacterium]|nr:sodium:solute symporter family protein [Cyclobacteriaceae bacterium]
MVKDFGGFSFLFLSLDSDIAWLIFAAYDQAQLLLTFIVIYLLFTIMLGVWASRRVHSSGDFMLAGRSLPIVLSTTALFATWFGSETVFGASSEFLEGGLYATIEDPFGASLCLLLFGLFFARKLYQMNLLTLGDYFKVRFGRKAELTFSALMIPSYFGYTAGQLVALGLILNVVTGLPIWQGVVISSFIVTLYTMAGGMWAVSITDFVQSIIIIIGLVVLAVVLAAKAGGVMTVLKEVPKENFRFLPALRPSEIISYMAAWSVLGLGSIPSQDVFQRVMSSGSPNVAVRSCYYASIMYLTIALIPLFISLCVKHLYPEQVEGDLQLVLPRMVMTQTGLGLQVLFFGSLLSAVMSTTSSSILAPAAVLSENIVKPLLKAKPTDRQLLLLTRTSVLLISIIATVMACWRTNIYELVAGASILSLVSQFIPLTMGLYWTKANGTGAIISMVGGMVTWGIFELYPIEIPSMVPALAVGFVSIIAGSILTRKEFSQV